MLPLILAIALAQISTSAANTPASELHCALVDLQQLPPILQPTTRYLTLYAVEPARRPAAAQTVSYALNALSRTRAITPPVFVSPTLLRFNITQYASQPDEVSAWSAAWEKLVDTDPY